MKIFLIGYLVAFFGFLIGYLFTLVFVKENVKVTSFLLGITGGLLISFASFELIPTSIEEGGVFISLFFMTFALIVIAYIESKYSMERFHIDSNNFLKVSIILGFGIGLHNLPEGFAIGSLYTNEEVFKSFLFVIMIHCIPESIALCIFLIKSKMKRKNILIVIYILSMPMGIGAFIGNALYNQFSFVMPISLSIASASMIYVACGEIIPNSKIIHKGVTSVIGSVLGFISGILLVYIF